MKNILLFSGSQRRDSLNTRLLNYVSSSLRTTFSIEFLGPDQVNLPLFNQDLEGNPSVISSVFEVHEKFNASDGIIVASPEYNGQVTPFLKNTVDWVSRLAYIDHAFDNPFVDRPLLLCSASTGAGGGALAGVIIGTLSYGWLCLFAAIPVIALAVASQRVLKD